MFFTYCNINEIVVPFIMCLLRVEVEVAFQPVTRDPPCATADSCNVPSLWMLLSYTVDSFFRNFVENMRTGLT